jgi:hypothetical protein
VIAQRVAAGLAVGGAVLLVVAELTTVFDVTVGSLEVVRRSVTGGENHGYALLVVAVAAAIMTRPALRGARPASVALVALGLTAMCVVLAIDLPDSRATGRLPESVAFEDAKARPQAGLYLAASGAGLLIVGGLALALTPVSSIRRSAGG